VGRLDQKRLELEQFVRQFENNNESYAKIKKTAKQEVECALAKSVLWKNCSTIYTTQRANYNIQDSIVPFTNEQLPHDHKKEESCEKMLRTNLMSFMTRW
jgi:hypothetical protein